MRKTLSLLLFLLTIFIILPSTTPAFTLHPFFIHDNTGTLSIRSIHAPDDPTAAIVAQYDPQIEAETPLGRWLVYPPMGELSDECLENHIDSTIKGLNALIEALSSINDPGHVVALAYRICLEEAAIYFPNDDIGFHEDMLAKINKAREDWLKKQEDEQKDEKKKSSGAI